MASRGKRLRESGAAGFSQCEAFDNVKDGGYEKDAEGAGGEHSANYRSAHDLTGDGACAGSGPEIPQPAPPGDRGQGTRGR